MGKRQKEKNKKKKSKKLIKAEGEDEKPTPRTTTPALKNREISGTVEDKEKKSIMIIWLRRQKKHMERISENK